MLVARAAAVAVGAVGLAMGLGAGAAEQLGPVAQGVEVADARQQDPHLGVGEDGAGDLAAAVEVLDLGEVVVDEQQLDAVAARGGEQVRQAGVAEDVAGLVEGQQQPGAEGTAGLRRRVSRPHG